MILSNVRPAFLTTIAILFATAQLLCVCSTANSNPNINVDSVHIQNANESGFGFASSILRDHQDTTPEDHNEHQHGGHDDHAVDCQHCADTVAVAHASDVLALVNSPAPGDDTYILPTIPEIPLTRAHMAAAALGGLRWLDPPPQTLVTLKIRLTI